MKGITCCSDCAWFGNNCCTKTNDKGSNIFGDNFFVGCPLPDVVPFINYAKLRAELATIKTSIKPKRERSNFYCECDNPLCYHQCYCDECGRKIDWDGC